MQSLKTPRVAFYLRVSKDEQTIENQLLDLQKLAALERWENITLFQDDGITGSVGREGRPSFDLLLHQAERGHFDIVAAWSLDRLGREPKDVFELAALATRKRFTIYLHQERIDTSQASGELFMTIIAGMAKFERRRLQERVHAGLDRARAQGKKLGRPKITDPELENKILEAFTQGMGKKAIAARYGCGVGTVYRILEEHNRQGTA